MYTIYQEIASFILPCSGLSALHGLRHDCAILVYNRDSQEFSHFFLYHAGRPDRTFGDPLAIERESIMQEAALSSLTIWQNFYVIIGSAAAALTGLMFVVVTLIMGTRMQRSSGTMGAFGTPTVVHFCVALLIAAILSAPWQVLWNASLLLGLCGLGGVVYIVIVLRRTSRQTDYKPVLEDWLWHTVFPLVSYITLVVAAILLIGNPVPTLFAIGAATVLLLFIGIHNAWDTVTFIVVEYSQPENKSQD